MDKGMRNGLREEWRWGIALLITAWMAAWPIPAATAPTESTAVAEPRLPQRYHADRVVIDELRLAARAAAPGATPGADVALPLTLQLPMPDGTRREFLLESRSVMAPELAARYPDIQSWRGVAADDPATWIVADLGPHGFHAMVTGPDGTVFVDPRPKGRADEVVSYRRADAAAPERGWVCEVDGATSGFTAKGGARSRLEASNQPSGSELRTYRLAVSATGEYTQYHGGTVQSGLAAVVTAVNRVNLLFNREISVHLELVANNDELIFTDPATDPFTNGDAFAMMGENAATLDSVIGNANFDIGHVFNTYGGGVAYLRGPCSSFLKGRASSGLWSPQNDSFWIGIVAHEMGHQFGANHTFNGSIGNCGANRSSSHAYEPGAGSTIMAYAGLCGSDNISGPYDKHFHAHSLSEMINFTTGSGNSCSARSPTGNTVPVPDAGPDFTIPIETPFMLTGSAVDPDGDSLTYIWEQYDLGPAGPPSGDDGQRPIFRSFEPTGSPTRLFPRLYDIVNGTTTKGETLPTTNRTLTFRFVVRDNALDGGGVDFDTAVLTATTSAGPFEVTSQEQPEDWPSGSTRSVTWDPAGTDAPPVSCAAVDIHLSLDGAESFTHLLAGGVPNDGQHTVVVPAAETSAGRIRVKCADNVFFDINDAVLTVTNDGFSDGDGDGIADAADNCPATHNPLQEDFDGDGTGYACDTTCAPSLDIAPVLANGDHYDLRASGQIRFGGALMNGADLMLDAGSVISLQAGTEVRAGGTLAIRMGGCSG